MVKKSIILMSDINFKEHIITVQFFLLILASGGVIHLYLGGFLTCLFIFLLFVLFQATTLLKFKFNILRQFFISELFFISILFLNYISANFSNDIFVYISLFLRLSIVNIFIFYLVNFRIKVLYYLYKALILIIILGLFNFVFSFLIVQYATQTKDILVLKTFFYIFNFQSEAEIIGINFYRNQSVFWEPGILAIFMNIFVLLSFLYRKFNFWFYASVFIILSTFSSTGLVIFVSQLIYFLFTKINRVRVKLLGLSFLIIIIFFLVVPNILKKTSGIGVASFDLRTFDIINAYSIILNNTFWGIGLDPNVYLKIYDNYRLFDFDFTYNVYSDVRGNTNSILMVFVCFGLFNGGVFYYIFFNKAIFGSNSIIFYFIVSISLFSEPLILSNFFLIIPLFFFYKTSFIKENFIEKY